MYTTLADTPNGVGIEIWEKPSVRFQHAKRLSVETIDIPFHVACDLVLNALDKYGDLQK